MASIDTLPSGHYRVRWRDPIGKQRSVTVRTKKEAVAKKAEVEVDASRGVWRDPAKGKETLESYAVELLGPGNGLASSTVATYETHARLYIFPALGAKPLYQITPADVRRLYRRLQDQGVGAPTVSAVGRLLSKILNQAERDDILPKSPTRSVEVPSPRRKKLRPPTLADVMTIADAAPPRYRTFILTAAVMGLRFGEAAALRRSSIDGDTLHVREQIREVRGHLELAPTKTDASDRAIRIPKELGRLLTRETDWMSYMHSRTKSKRKWGEFEATVGADPRLRAIHAPNGTWDPLIFTGPTFRPLSHTRFNARVWKKAVAAAGVSPPPTFHDLRRVPGGIAVKKGTSLKVIQDRLGHANYKTTADLYSGLVPGVDAGFTALLDEAWQEVTGSEGEPSDPKERRIRRNIIRRLYGAEADVSQMWHDPEVERVLEDVQAAMQGV